MNRNEHQRRPRTAVNHNNEAIPLWRLILETELERIRNDTTTIRDEHNALWGRNDSTLRRPIVINALEAEQRDIVNKISDIERHLQRDTTSIKEIEAALDKAIQQLIEQTTATKDLQNNLEERVHQLEGNTDNIREATTIAREVATKVEQVRQDVRRITDTAAFISSIQQAQVNSLTRRLEQLEHQQRQQAAGSHPDTANSEPSSGEVTRVNTPEGVEAIDLGRFARRGSYIIPIQESSSNDSTNTTGSAEASGAA